MVSALEENNCKTADTNQNELKQLPNERDTIPATVKELFFPGVEKPDLCLDYDVLGFDADHCLVKYNL